MLKIVNILALSADMLDDNPTVFDHIYDLFVEVARERNVDLVFKPATYTVYAPSEHIREMFRALEIVVNPTHESFVGAALNNAYSEFITLSDTLGYDTEFMKRSRVNEG